MSFAADLLRNPKAKVGSTVPPAQTARTGAVIENDGMPPNEPAAKPICRRCKKPSETKLYRGVCDSCETDMCKAAYGDKEESASKAIKARINENAAAGKSIILSAQEVLALKQFITEMEFDPFRDQQAVLDTRDLEKLGLEVDANPAPNADDDDGLPPDPFKDGASEADAKQRDQSSQIGSDRIEISTAVVAPDATPGHDEPIPQSVLQSLDVLAGKGVEAPVNMTPPPPVAPHVEPPPAPPAATVAAESVTEAKVAPKTVPITEFVNKFRKAYKRTGGMVSEDKKSGNKPAETISEERKNTPETGKAVEVKNFMAKFRKAYQNG